jgi:hypothetical protein
LGNRRRTVAAAVRLAPRNPRAVVAVVMGSKKRRYTGELARPVIRPAPPTFEGAVTPKRVKEFWRRHKHHERDAKCRVEEELLRKMSLLMKHYGVADENDMTRLVWALASDHVPGFRIVPERQTKVGRKKEWHGLKLQALFDAVKVVKEKHHFNDRQALHFISTNNEYAGIWGPPASYNGSRAQWAETLESRLHDAKGYVARSASDFEEFQQIRSSFLRKKSRKS